MKFSQISEEDKAILLSFKPIRLSRYEKGVNDECCICHRKICGNEIYYDGGLRKRAHRYCVQNYLYNTSQPGVFLNI